MGDLEVFGVTEAKRTNSTCPYCGGKVSRRGWVISEQQINAKGEWEEVDQMVHQKCQKEQNAY